MKKEKAFSRRYCFFENAKNLGQSDNGKQRKKGISLRGENVNLIKNGQGLIPRTIKVLKGTARYCTSPNVMGFAICTSAQGIGIRLMIRAWNSSSTDKEHNSYYKDNQEYINEKKRLILYLL